MFIRLLFIDAIRSSINNQSAIILEKVALQFNAISTINNLIYKKFWIKLNAPCS